jgi:hypothetical protein
VTNFSILRYWLSGQTSKEPFVFVMYDTKGGEHARCEEMARSLSRPYTDLPTVCPHVSFNNPIALDDAPPRQSVETRSIVITKE